MAVLQGAAWCHWPVTLSWKCPIPIKLKAARGSKMVEKRKSNALLHIANYGIVRFRTLQIVTGEGGVSYGGSTWDFILRLPYIYGYLIWICICVAKG